MKCLVLVVRGLRPAFLGCYGHEWPTTPALDRLAAEGVVFDRHIADCPDAAGARGSWRSGCYHFPLANGSDGPSTEANDLIHSLRQHDVMTVLITDGSRPGVPQFAQGWDRVTIVPAAGEESPLERTLEAAVASIKKLARRDRWLIWVELATLLPPWVLPDEFRGKYFDPAEVEGEDGKNTTPLEPLVDPAAVALSVGEDQTYERLMRTYAGAVTFLDAGVELLLEELDNRKTMNDLFLAITGDHGLPLGEHGIIGADRSCLHSECVHLPLLLRLPGGAEAGRRIPALTQAIDLMPTLLDAFAIPRPPMHGHSLLPLVRGEVEQVRDYACSGLQLGEALQWRLQTPEWSLLLPGEGVPPRLYVQPDDPWEVNDLRQKHLELAEQLEQTLRDFLAAACRGLLLPQLPNTLISEEGL
jgi:arylsulfatase A-like enzyme